MSKFYLWAFAALVSGFVQPVTAQTVLPLGERVARLPDANFRAWFGTMLTQTYREIPGWQTFFGDVGPTEGCAAIREINRGIVDRDLGAFRAAYVAAVTRGMAQSVFSDVPDSRLGIQFDSRISRFGKDLDAFLRLRALEMAERASRWSERNGYRGRRLGYNGAGVAYWRGQPRLTVLVCAVPDATGLLRGWKD